jgi:protoheme IX farnesyltransferase
MLPAVTSLKNTARQIVAYTVLLVVTSLLFTPAAGMGVLYTGAALITGGVFLAFAVRLARHPTTENAMRLFGWSITYVTILFGAMAADQLLR